MVGVDGDTRAGAHGTVVDLKSWSGGRSGLSLWVSALGRGDPVGVMPWRAVSAEGKVYSGGSGAAWVRSGLSRP